MKREVDYVLALGPIATIEDANATYEDIRKFAEDGWTPWGEMGGRYWFTRDLPEERPGQPISCAEAIAKAHEIMYRAEQARATEEEPEAPRKDVTVLESDGFNILWRDRHDVNTLNVTEVKGHARLTITRLD